MVSNSFAKEQGVEEYYEEILRAVNNKIENPYDLLICYDSKKSI